MVQQHKTIESVISNFKEKYDFSNLTPKLIQQVRKLFLFPEVRKITNFTWNFPNEAKVKELYFEEHNMERERMENNLAKFISNFEKCKKLQTFELKPQAVQKTLFL